MKVSTKIRMKKEDRILGLSQGAFVLVFLWGVILVWFVVINFLQEQPETEFPNDGKLRYNYVLFDDNNMQYILDCVGQTCEFKYMDNFKHIVTHPYREGNEWGEPVETTTTTLLESQLIFGIAHPINLKEGDEYCYPLPSEPNCRWEEGLDGKFREFCYSTLEINEVCYVKE